MAALNNGVANSSSAAGNPDTYQFIYRGPSINTGGAAVTSTAEAVQQVFDWFFANGGPNLPLTGSPNIPGVTPQIRGSLTSPNVLEYAGGINRQFGSRAAVRADVVYRDYHDLYASRTDQTTGLVIDKLGRPFDLALIENTDALSDGMPGLSTQGTYRVSSALDLGGNYTLSRTWGNFDGETLAGGPARAPTCSTQSTPRVMELSRGRSRHGPAPSSQALGDLRVALGLGPHGERPSDAGIWCALRRGDDKRRRPAALCRQPGLPDAADRIDDGVLLHGPGCVSHGRSAPNGHGGELFIRHHGLGRIQLFGQLQVINIFNQFQLCGCGAPVAQNGGAIRTERIDQAVRTAVTTPAAIRPSIRSPRRRSKA